MKVAVVVPSLQPTGPVRVAFDLAKAMQDKVQMDFFYFDEVEGAVAMEGAVQLSFMELNPFEGYDIVHSHGLRPDAYLWFHAKGIAAKKVSTLHNYVQEDLTYQYNAMVSAIFTKVWKYMCGRHDRLVALSEHMKTYYESLWETDKLSVIPNTRVLDTMDEKDQTIASDILRFKEAESFTLGSVGYVTERKGLDQIIRLLAMDSKLKYVHIGDGKELDNLRILAERLQVEDRCLFLGKVPNAHLYMPLFDAVVMPSRSEGFPLALLESVQLGVPVIVSDLPVFKEAFEADELFFFELENLSSLEKAIERCRTQGDAAAKKALAHFERSYSPGHIAEQYVQLYQELLTHE